MKTSDLCDACEGAAACELPWVGFGRRRAFAGFIRTFRYREGLTVLRDLVNEPGTDQVLVIDAGGLRTGAVFGDVMAARAIAHGWAGVVVHGVIRDRAEIDAMDLGVKALGTFPRRAPVAGGGERDVVLQFGGVTFAPGKRLVADEDGVLVLPAGMTEKDVDVAGVVAATAAYASAGAKS